MIGYIFLLLVIVLVSNYAYVPNLHVKFICKSTNRGCSRLFVKSEPRVETDESDSLIIDGSDDEDGQYDPRAVDQELLDYVDEQLYDFTEVDTDEETISKSFNYDRDGDGYGYYDDNLDNNDGENTLTNPEDVKRMEKNDVEWMFFDVAKVNVKGGDGGKYV